MDGLRGVAVLAVVLYHIFPAVMPGGFAGVDVFFVLSGYLVTAQCLARRGAGWSWLAEFYGRRIRRLTPALLCVLACTLLAGWLTLLPGELAAVGRDVAASALSAGNLLAWHEQGYFDRAAMLKPLLHLWSLGVEEQFYALWPVCLLVMGRVGGRLSWGIGGLAGLSLGLDCYHTAIGSAAGFYSPLDRMWEFMPGALLAALPAWNMTERQKTLWSGVGVVGVVLALACLRPGWHFPAPAAVLPVLGTVLVLQAGLLAWPNRVLLSARPLRWLGLVSYPLYLWHWPLVAWYHIVHGAGSVRNSAGFAILAGSVLLAWLTVLVVEKPVRAVGGQRRWTGWLLLALGVLVVVGLGTWRARGWPGRPLPWGGGTVDAARITLAAGDGIFPITAHMHAVRSHGLTVATLGDTGSPIMLTGDSLLAQWGPRVEELFQQGRLRHQVVLVAGPSCAPFEGGHDAPGFTFCQRMAGVRDGLIQARHIHTVVMGAFWPGALARYDGGQGAIVAEYSRQISQLRQLGVSALWLVLPSPFDDRFNPRALLRRSLWHVAVDRAALEAGIPMAQLHAATDQARQTLLAVAAQSGAMTLDPYPDVCGSGAFCSVINAQGEPKYADEKHLRPVFVKDNIHFLDALLTR